MQLEGYRGMEQGHTGVIGAVFWGLGWAWSEIRPRGSLFLKASPGVRCLPPKPMVLRGHTHPLGPGAGAAREDSNRVSHLSHRGTRNKALFTPVESYTGKRLSTRKGALIGPQWLQSCGHLEGSLLALFTIP